MKPKLVVLSGAGISAESGIKTFREGDGLWEEFKIDDVATPQGWEKNKELVLDFYNQRRIQVINTNPNLGHKTLVDLEFHFDVQIITQNVDDLHERAGSKNILHLHGEIMKSRSTANADLIYPVEKTLNVGDLCAEGYQLRPHIVWFGEMVPAMDIATEIIAAADVVIIVGTSMVVYPAASLIDFVPKKTPVYVVDPNDVGLSSGKGLNIIKEKASIGLPIVAKKLLKV